MGLKPQSTSFLRKGDSAGVERRNRMAALKYLKRAREVKME